MSRSDVSFETGETYKEMGLLREAISEFEKTLTDEALKFRAVRRIAECLVGLGLAAQAESLLLTALCLEDIPKKDRMWLYSDLANLFLDTDRKEAALERLVQIRNEDPDFFSDLSQRISDLKSNVDFSVFENASCLIELAPQPQDAGASSEIPAVVQDPNPPANVEPRRRAPRYKFSARVEYSFDQTSWQTGYSMDISALGMFIVTHQPVPVGSLAFLKFDLPGAPSGAGAELIGHIVRQENKKQDKGAVLGMGLQFLSLDDIVARRIDQLIRQLRSQEGMVGRKTTMIRFHCDFCGRIITAPETLSGKPGMCACGRSVPVPYIFHNPSQENPLRGMKLAGCRIDSVIGRGSVATVYKGHHLTLDIPVAVKILSPAQKKAESQMAQRFLKEARVIARINHANIVSVMNAGEENEQRFIVMQFVPGRSLANALERGEKLTVNDFIRVFLDVCNALNAAHERSIVHGDVKPANILLTPSNNSMLVDFGLVKDFTTYKESESRGPAMGTPLYMAPEQARGEKGVDFRSDVYSLAATMYHVLAGKPPYQGTSALEVIRKHIELPFPAPTELSIAAPGKMWDIVAKGMEKGPEKRFQSVDELKQELLTVSRELALEQFKPLYPSMKRKKKNMMN